MDNLTMRFIPQQLQKAIRRVTPEHADYFMEGVILHNHKTAPMIRDVETKTPRGMIYSGFLWYKQSMGRGRSWEHLAESVKGAEPRGIKWADEVHKKHCDAKEDF